jgi:pSer/pThr/pTyr-binding forkhead associated (FHA) protein
MIAVLEELWIEFVDVDGSRRREKIARDRFIIGRHSGSDLCIPDSRLSREHVKIERLGDKFLVCDLGSTNGTSLNGEELSDTETLRHGDELDLGGGVIVKIEISVPGKEPAKPEPAAVDEDELDGENLDGEVSGSSPTVDSASRPTPAATGSSIPTSVFIIAPIFGLLVLAFAGVLIYVFSTGGQAKQPEGNDFVYTTDPEDTPSKGRKNTNSTSDNKNSTEPPANTTTTASPETGPSLPTKELSETGKSEQNAAAFLRKIAQNDPKAFLTSDQAATVNNKIKQLSGSSAIADNINSARKSAAQIRSLAAAKNLKPQFLATAAIAKLGNSRGDVLQTAQSMAEIFSKLETQIGSELADDSLLMVAAFDQGANGDFMKMRNMLQDLATKFPESSRSIRTIWFLHKNGKITDAEFDFAIRFLAAGTISQNPKDFNVNCDALIL